MRLLIAALTFALVAGPAAATSRIKDLVDVEGVRENMLVGYGLVVGLEGTGDSLRNAPFTRQSLEAMLERLGVNTREANLNTRNVAAVMVTANLPPFATQGARMDVSVSALGDARSLSGGTLLVTPLIGADGQAYAVAQGSLTVGGFAAQGAAAEVSRGVPTNGRIANGALIERELRFDLAGQTELRLALRNPDFTTARRIADAINRDLKVAAATPLNPSTVRLAMPVGYPGDMVGLVSRVETLGVAPDQPARIVVDEASGIVVMSDAVRVNTVAIAQGNLTISVAESPIASQPAPLSPQGQTQVLPRTDVQAVEDEGDLTIVRGGAPLKDLVDGLNALGVAPRDLIGILNALKAAGALQADIEVM